MHIKGAGGRLFRDTFFISIPSLANAKSVQFLLFFFFFLMNVHAILSWNEVDGTEKNLKKYSH